MLKAGRSVDKLAHRPDILGQVHRHPFDKVTPQARLVVIDGRELGVAQVQARLVGDRQAPAHQGKAEVLGEPLGLRLVEDVALPFGEHPNRRKAPTRVRSGIGRTQRRYAVHDPRRHWTIDARIPHGDLGLNEVLVADRSHDPRQARQARIGDPCQALFSGRAVAALHEATVASAGDQRREPRRAARWGLLLVIAEKQERNPTKRHVMAMHELAKQVVNVPEQRGVVERDLVNHKAADFAGRPAAFVLELPHLFVPPRSVEPLNEPLALALDAKIKETQNSRPAKWGGRNPRIRSNDQRPGNAGQRALEKVDDHALAGAARAHDEQHRAEALTP